MVQMKYCKDNVPLQIMLISLSPIKLLTEKREQPWQRYPELTVKHRQQVLLMLLQVLLVSRCWRH
jgi:hypothetical protein